VKPSHYKAEIGGS